MTYVQEQITTSVGSSFVDNSSYPIVKLDRTIIINILNSADPSKFMSNQFPISIPMSGMLPELIFDVNGLEFRMNASLYEYDEREVKYIIPSVYGLKLQTEFGRRTLELMDDEMLKYYLEMYCSSPFISFQIV